MWVLIEIRFQKIDIAVLNRIPFYSAFLFNQTTTKDKKEDSNKGEGVNERMKRN